VVPLYDDAASMCIGYASRYEGPACPKCGLYHEKWVGCGLKDDRWRISKGFSKSDYLYNYAWVRGSRKPVILLVEGAGSVWRLTAVGAPSVACMGSDLTQAQASSLAGLKKEVLVAFDNDDAGRDGARRALDALSQRGVTARILAVPAEFNDLGEMPSGAVAEWLRETVGMRASA
jgi:DNA primase